MHDVYTEKEKDTCHSLLSRPRGRSARPFIECTCCTKSSNVLFGLATVVEIVRGLRSDWRSSGDAFLALGKPLDVQRRVFTPLVLAVSRSG